MIYSRIRICTFVSAVLACAPFAKGAISVSDQSDNGIWVEVLGNFDYNADQQTGQSSSDIIGVAPDASGHSTDPGFFTAYDGVDDELAFRVRTNAQNGTKSYYGGYLWVGIDVDNDYAVDAYVNYTSSNAGSLVRIFGPGTGANDRPSTTTVVAPTNTNNTYEWTDPTYSNYRAVTGTDWDGAPVGTTNDAGGDGNTDWYASFKIDYDFLLLFLQDSAEMGANAFSAAEVSGFDPTQFGFIVASSTQPNSLNQDIGGIDGNTDTAWIDGPMGPIPEPSSSMMLMLGGMSLLLRRRRA